MLTMETHFPCGTVTTEEVETVRGAIRAFRMQRTANVALVYMQDHLLFKLSRTKKDRLVRTETYWQKDPPTRWLPRAIPDYKIIPVLQQLLTA